MALGSVVKWAVGPYCGSGDASLIHDELIPTGIETGAQFIVPAGIHPSKHASSGKSVGDGERQRAVAVRNRRNFLQVESKDLC
jgi:hypothetical protein